MAPRVSVCLPARDEATTVGAIVADMPRPAAPGHGGLVDEVVVLDDGSTDAPRRWRGGRCTGGRERDVLPEAGPGSGKGNALWKSLLACEGDILCFLDADLRNFRGEYVERLWSRSSPGRTRCSSRRTTTGRSKARRPAADA